MLVAKFNGLMNFVTRQKEHVQEAIIGARYKIQGIDEFCHLSTPSHLKHRHNQSYQI